MSHSGSSFSFAAVAKLALVLTTIGYVGVVAHRMREQNAQLRKAMDEARAEREKLREQVAAERRRGEDAVEKTRNETQFWWRMEGLARAELTRKEAALKAKEDELVAQREQIHDLQTHLRDGRVAPPGSPGLAHGSRVDVEASGQVAELPAVQPPTSTFDDVVLHMVRTLNLEISEVASQVTNAFRIAETPDADRVALAFDRAREAVGPVMAELLETIQHQDDPILIDIALKADMVGFAAEIASAWDFQHQSKSVFTGVYKQMRRSGTQGSHASSFRPRVCIPR